MFATPAILSLLFFVYIRPQEFDLLAALVRHRGRVVSRDALLTEVWGYAAGTESRTVETHLTHAYRKLDVRTRQELAKTSW